MNHVTARSINSPSDLCTSFSKNQPTLDMFGHCDYTFANNGDGHTNNKYDSAERPFSISTHKAERSTLVRQFSNHGDSRAGVAHRRSPESPDKDHGIIDNYPYHGGLLKSPVSKDGPSQVVEQQNSFGLSRSRTKAVPVYRSVGDSSAGEVAQSPGAKVELRHLAKPVKHKLGALGQGKVRIHPQYKPLVSFNGEARHQSHTDHHLLITLPESAAADDGWAVDKEDRMHKMRRRRHSNKAVYSQPKYVRLGLLKKRHSSRGYVDAYSDQEHLDDDEYLYDDVFFDEGVQDQVDKEPYPDQQHGYSFLSCEEEEVNSSDSQNTDHQSDLSTSDEEVYIIGKENVKISKTNVQDRYIKKKKILDKKNIKKVIPVFIHKRSRSESPVAYRRSRDRKYHHPKPARVRSLNRSDDLDVASPGSDKESFDTKFSRQQERQKKPSISSQNQNNVSSIKISSFKDDDFTSTPSGINPQPSFDMNFLLYPNAGFSPTVTNPYVGYPYSFTSGYTDQLLRGTNFVTLKSHMDVLSASLASIPAPTLGGFPYMSQQFPAQQNSDTLYTAENQDFFTNANSLSIDRMTGQTPSTLSHNWSDMKLSKTGPEFIGERFSATLDSVQNETNFAVNSTEQKTLGQNIVYGEVARVGECADTNVYSTDASRMATNKIITSLYGDCYATDSRAKINAKSQQIKRNDVTDRRQKVKFKDIQEHSTEEPACDLSHGTRTKEKMMAHSAVQADIGCSCAAADIQSQTTSLPVSKHGAACTTESTGLESQSSVSSSCRIKSSLPVTMPSPMSERETSLNDGLSADPQKIRASSIVDQVKVDPSLQNDHETNDQTLPQPLGSNFFAISNLSVIDLPEKVQSDDRNAIRKELVKHRIEEFSALAGALQEMYSVTQISCPYSTNPHSSADPEVDYDIYPPRPGVDGSLRSSRRSETEATHDKLPTSMSPGRVRFQSMRLPPSHKNSLFSPTVNNSFVLTPKILAISPTRASQKPPGHVQGSSVEWSHPHRNVSSDPSLNPENPTAKWLDQQPKSLTTVSTSSQAQKPRDDSVKVQYQIPRVKVTPASHLFSPTAPESQSRAPSPEILQPPMADDTCSGASELSFEYYTGDPFLLSAATNNNTQLSVLPQHLSSFEGVASLFDDPTNRIKIETDDDLSDKGYILYKGHNRMPFVSEDSPDYDADLKQEEQLDTEMKDILDAPGLSVAGLQRQEQQEVPVPNQKHIVPQVPIPLRDFDSEADSLEYIYTSEGWSRMPDIPHIATVMHCARVSDNRTECMQQFYSQWMKKEATDQTILEKVLRDGLQKYTGNSHKTKPCSVGTPELFDAGQCLDLSSKTLPLKVNSVFDVSMPSNKKTLPLLGHPRQSQSRDLKSVDFDSGLSSLNSTSTHDLDLHYRDRTRIPDADYSSQSSNISYSSGELGWDSLSCNARSAQRKAEKYEPEVSTRKTSQQVLDAESTCQDDAVTLQTNIKTFLQCWQHLPQREVQNKPQVETSRCDFTTPSHGVHIIQTLHQIGKEREKFLEERQAQTMASVANLDIPGELAVVYSKIDDWELYQNGHRIIAASGDVVPMNMDYKLPVDINSHAFSRFVNIYFKHPNWGVQMEPIRSCFISVQGEDNATRAIAVFKLILRFMCDTRLNEKQEKVLSDYIVQMGLRHEGIRDEILCQLVSQTWLNQNLQQTEKLWRLMANCLSCFNPGLTLFKHLLKYVSDVGPNIYKQACQHKLLQSAFLDPQLSRIYPPTFLEWKTIERKANMGLEVRFSDGAHLIGHVESWTSGEQFTSHLLKLRGMTENCQGWTLQMQEDDGYFELMGYDYVLDLISETEIAPGFPAGTAYFLVSVDRSKEGGHQRRRRNAEGPHNPEKERIFVLTESLPEITRTVEVKNEFNLSKTSVLNQRSTEVHPTGLSEDSLLNVRYTNHINLSKTSPLNPQSTEVYPAGLSEDSPLNVRYKSQTNLSKTVALNQQSAETHPVGLSEDSPLNVRYTNHIKTPTSSAVKDHVAGGTEDEDDLDFSDLSTNRLNTRYFLSGEERMPDTEELSESKLNHRYNRKSKQELTKTSREAAQYNPRGRSHDGAPSALSENSDWSHLVEDIFSNALNEHDRQDGKTLGSRIKGGGRGVPGFQTQQPITQPMSLSYGLTNPVLNVGQPTVFPALNFVSSAPLPTVGLLSTVDPLQQATAQHLAQQQASVQNYLLQQPQNTNQAQQVLQAQKQQTAVLRVALEQQELENKLLKQSIEQEALKQQLQQIKFYQEMPPVIPLAVPMTQTVQMTPSVPVMNRFTSLNQSSSFRSIGNSGLVRSGRVMSNANLTAETALPPQHEVPVIHETGPEQDTDEQHVPQSKVSFIKSVLERQEQSLMPNNPPPAAARQSKAQSQAHLPQSANSSNAAAQKVTFKSAAPVDSHQNPPPQTLSSPSHPAAFQQPLPPVVSPAQTLPEAPAIEIDKNSGTFTIRDKSGQAQAVRVGKVMWPPAIETQEKNQVKVGKLEINERVASGIENRIKATKKWQKPEPPKHDESNRPKSILNDNVTKAKPKRGTSLAETSSHVSTMRMLEQKLRGVPSSSTSRTTETAPHIQKSSEYTDTEDNLYEKTIEADEPPPPPVPKSTPPKLQRTKVTETSEPKQTSGQYNNFTEPEPVMRPASPVNGPQEMTETKPQTLIDYAAFEHVTTELFSQNMKFFLMYNKMPWTLHVRKEVFRPDERLENPVALHLIYCQIISDVYDSRCVRISEDQRIKMKRLIESHGVNQHTYLTTELKVWTKKVIVDTAKEWPVYFSRLFPVAFQTSGQYSGVRYIGVSHAGLQLVTRERQYDSDFLSAIEEIRFDDVIDVFLHTSSTLMLNLKTGSLILQTTKAKQLKDMIDRFSQANDKETGYVVGVRDFTARESTLLSFKQGDIIKLINPEMNLKSGWMYGCLSGTVGLFPDTSVKPLTRQEVEALKNKSLLYQPKLTRA